MQPGSDNEGACYFQLVAGLADHNQVQGSGFSGIRALGCSLGLYKRLWAWGYGFCGTWYCKAGGWGDLVSFELS